MTFDTDTIYLNLETLPTEDVVDDICDGYQTTYENFYLRQIPHPIKLWIGYRGVRLCYVNLELNLLTKKKNQLLEASIA